MVDVLIGKKIGRLLVLEKTNKRANDGHILYKCECDCGNIKNIESSSLRGKIKTKSCGCLRRDTNSLPEGESLLNALYYVYKVGAKKRDLEFSLDKITFSGFIRQSCYYCNESPYQLYRFKSCQGELIYTGIDRVDNSRGYTTDNCVPCCKKCNTAKMDMSIEEFYIWINKISENLKCKSVF